MGRMKAILTGRMQAILSERAGGYIRYIESMTFGERLGDIMARERVDQSELARRLDITSQAVNQWLKQKTTPKGARLGQIAKALGVEVHELMNWTRKDLTGPEISKLPGDEFLKLLAGEIADSVEMAGEIVRSLRDLERARRRSLILLCEMMLLISKDCASQLDSASDRTQQSLALIEHAERSLADHRKSDEDDRDPLEKLIVLADALKKHVGRLPPVE